jgi:hypothetical protein
VLVVAACPKEEELTLRILSNREVPLLVLLRERPRRLLLLALVERRRRPRLLPERNPLNDRALLVL